MSCELTPSDSAARFAIVSFCRKLLRMTSPLFLCCAPAFVALANAGNDPPAVSVSISPTYAVVQLGQPLQFTATVNGTGNTKVTWQVDNADGGDSTSGTISTSGLFTAPSSLPTPATASVTAVSQADPTKSATAVVTLVTQPASGTTYYVAITGSDSNPGTFSQPWKTIQHAADTVVAGDTV